MNEFNGILEQVPETGLIPELDAIIDSEVLQLNSVNTAVQTKRWVASFKNYIKSVNGKEEIESLSDYELNEYLKNTTFNWEQMKKDFIVKVVYCASELQSFVIFKTLHIIAFLMKNSLILQQKF